MQWPWSRKKNLKDKEWITETLARIQKLQDEFESDFNKKFRKQEPDTVKYSLREDNVRHSLNVEGISTTSFMEWEMHDGFMCMTFQEALVTLIEERGLENRQFYKRAHIDRKLFSAIYNNKEYQPKKDTAVACCFGLKLNLEDSLNLLETAGYTLSRAIQWDRVVIYCIDKGISDIDVVNQLLYELGEKCIRA